MNKTQSGIIAEVKPKASGLQKDGVTPWTIFEVKWADGTKASSFDTSYLGLLGKECSRELTERQYIDKLGVNRTSWNIVEPAGQPKAHSFPPTTTPVRTVNPAPQSNAVTRAEFESLKGRVAALESGTGIGLNLKPSKSNADIPPEVLPF